MLKLGIGDRGGGICKLSFVALGMAGGEVAAHLLREVRPCSLSVLD